jgi:polyisoprenoid-binding protein YceI
MKRAIREIVLDDRNTRVAFSVRWFGVLSVTGTFPGLHGVLTLPADGLDDASVSIDVEAGAVATGIALRDRHLRGPRFLDSARHPFISFRSSRLVREDGHVSVEGTLSLRGIEQFVTSRCPVREGSLDGANTLAFQSTLQVSRQHFGVGLARGSLAFRPLAHAISDTVTVDIAVSVPAIQALPALLPALGR